MPTSKRRKPKAHKVVTQAEKDHPFKVLAMRRSMVRILNNIKSGSVTEEDLDRLWNFTQFSLNLMELAPLRMYEEAKVMHELKETLLEVLPDGTEVVNS